MTFNEFVSLYKKYSWDPGQQNRLANEFLHTYVKDHCRDFYFKLMSWNTFREPELISVDCDRVVYDGRNCCDTKYRCSIRPDKCSCYCIGG